MTEPLIDRIAGIINPLAFDPKYSDTSSGKIWKAGARMKAREILAAIRGPTRKMVSGVDALFDSKGGIMTAEQAWPAMIDAALQEEPE